MPYIYKITNDVNQKIYVGKTESSIEKRFQEHCKDAFKERSEKRPLYTAMRKYGIEHFHIELLEETNQPEEQEIYWIELLRSFKQGYNATKGGDGRPYLDYDIVVELYNSGCNCSEIGHITGYSLTSIRKILNNNGITKEQRQSNCGQYQNTTVKMIDKDNGEILRIFPKISDAYRFLGKRKSSHIQEVCRGKRKTAYGYKWSY